MASDDPAQQHRRNQSANIIPLQDLNGDGAASQEHDGGLSSGLGRRESHRRTLSERVAHLRNGGQGRRRYAPLSERSPSPPTARSQTARTSPTVRRSIPVSPVAFVTSPSGQHERIPDQDDEAEYSPVADRGAFQSAIGFAGLSFQAEPSSPSGGSDDEVEQTPSRQQPRRTARASHTSLPSLRTQSSVDDDMVSVQLEDGGDFYSPAPRDEEDDTQPLTDSSRRRLQAERLAGAGLTPPGQPHDRSRSRNNGSSPSGRSRTRTVKFIGGPSPRSSRANLGDDLRVETGVSKGLDRSPSSRIRSLSPSSADSPLTSAGAMLRKMSQRVVNVSNESTDTMVSRDVRDNQMRRKSTLRRPSLLVQPPATISESRVRDFGATDGANSSLHSRTSEKTPSPSPAVEQPETPHELPRIDRNPLRGKSLGLFGPESRMRQTLLNFLVHPWWQPFILLLIVIQAVVVAIDSAESVYTNPRPSNWGHRWTDYALFAIFVVYTVEVVIQILVSGLIVNPREYSTIDRSNGVRQALINKANDLFALHRQPTIKDGRMRPEAPPSLLRSFTAETFEDMPGTSRQSQKVRLARRAFLRHSFNRIDFVAVVSFWVSFVLSAAGIVSRYHLYVFEMMSCLRIFRLLNITSGTSVILRSLKRAAPTLLNVSFLIGFFWLLFAIVGVQSFKSSLRRTCVFDGSKAYPPTENYTQDYMGGNGNLQFCGGWLAPNGTEMPWVFKDGQFGAAKHKGYLCPVGSYCVQGDNPYNGTVSFDNIGNSLELVFVIMSTNTFSDIMYMLTNTDYLVAALYFAVGIVLLTFWLINLLIAVITSSFQVIREESRSSAFMAQETDAEKDDPEDDDQSEMNGMNGSIKSWRREPTLKRLYHKSRWFWVAVIVYGLIVNCTRHDTMGPFLTNFISVSELIVSLVLLGEILIRFSVDWRGFIHSGRDWFDLFLAVTTTIMEIPVVKHAYDGQAYAWLTVFQILRVYRVVLAISITRDLVLLVLKHVSGVLNLILFVFLLTFLAAIFAVQLFRGDLPETNPAGANLYVTFATIYNAYLGMYQILSSENWTDILYAVTASEQHWGMAWIGATFIVLWFIFAFFITLNMFIAVIQENFDVNEDQKRLHQVRAILQQSEIGGHSGSTLSLSTIFKFWKHKRQDPLEFGKTAKEMLLKDGLIQEFLDAQFDNELASAKPGISASTTFDILNGKQSTVNDWWTKLRKRIFDPEPNPFYSKMDFTRGYEQLDIETLRKDLQKYQDQRKGTQREYLKKHPTYNVSLFIFRPDNPIRRACQRVVGPGRGSERFQGLDPINTIWYSFSAFIYLAIVAMVILACYTTPLYQQEYFNDHETNWSWFSLCDVGFAALFTIEAAIKVIADGFFWTPNAYFRSSWGFIDGIVLLTLWVNVVTLLYDPGGGSRAVGAFKALRALRLLNVSDSARDTFHSVIILGGWKVVSAAFVSISLLIPFAIYGLNLFAGKMAFCNEMNGSGNPIDRPFATYNLTDCVGEFYFEGYNWKYPAPRQVRNNWYDFDSFGNALFLLFQIVSQEGWVEAMWSGQSITGVFTQPANFATQGNAVFFVVFNLLGAVFVLTLFISVFMRNYTEQTGVAFLTTDQRSWLELRKLLKQVAPSKRPNNKKKRENWQEWCYRRAVTKTGRWHRSVTAILVLHLILLCLEYYPEPWAWSQARDYLYLGFTAFYIVNIIVRVIGLSWTRFRKSAWDVYSIFAIGGTFLTTGLLLSNFHEPYYAQLHKLFLVSVVLLLIPRNNQLDQLFKTAAASLTSISNLLATWFVLFLVYAIAMNQAFGLTRFSYNETNNINFRTVPKSLILLFRMSVGEGWNQIMEDFARVVPPYCTVAENYFGGDCGSPEWARALFISWNILSMYIFVNLFISLIYESFSYVYQRSNGLSIISREEIRRFKQAWAEFDPNGIGYLSKAEFPRFLGELSGVFEMRIYDGDFSVRNLIEDCKMAPKRASQLPVDGASSGPVEIDLHKLNRRLAELPVDEIRTRRKRMNQFYEEVMVSADPDRGIEFNTLLMIIAHYKIIDDTKALKIDEFVRRRARLQRVEDAVGRHIVQGFFDTIFWSLRYKKYKRGKQAARVTAIPDLGVPEIFIQDESDGEDITRTDKFDVPSVAVTPVDYDPSDTADSLGIGRAPTSGSDASRNRQAGSGMRNRSGSIQTSAPPSPTATMDSPYLSARHRPTPSSSSIQPDWHFAAAMENAGSTGAVQGLSPPASPGLTGDFGTAMRDRASSNVSQNNDMLSLFGDSAWGQSMRRSVTQRRRASGRRPSGT